MRRADRLFRIVQLLRGRQLSTAAWLAREARGLGAHRLSRRGRPAGAGRADRRRGRRRLPARRRLRPAAADVHDAGSTGAGRGGAAGAEPPRSRAGAGRRGRARQDRRRAAAGGARRGRGAAAVRGTMGQRPRPGGRRAAGRAARRGLDAPTHPLRLRGRPRRRHFAHRAAAGLLPLARRVDAGRLVRTPHRVPQLPHRPHAHPRRAGRLFTTRPAAPCRTSCARPSATGSRPPRSPARCKSSLSMERGLYIGPGRVHNGKHPFHLEAFRDEKQAISRRS